MTAFVVAVLNSRSMVAQSFMFILAGFDTTASVLAFSSFLLAKNKDQQQRLRDEVRQIVKKHGDITYQGIIEAKLLDACLQGSYEVANIQKNNLKIVFFIENKLCTRRCCVEC